ncbi:MAG: 16S rRNA (adenine(1518)-N(6)/adenine(1519)-N(6))-dimethyltransferase RsmA [Pseudomonadota bacterium]|nr:16S rRNA (adenine(1518)-N(6)/adenine(1519)-N(6))-dimethyltransferase RsmA [Pseudomonadota bacterium]
MNSSFKVSARQAKKRLGQHFLRDRQVISRIIDLAAPKPGESVLEIGPGEGVLTAALLESGARVVAVETDGDLWEPLEKRFSSIPETDFSLQRGDFLKTDLDKIISESRNLSAPVAVVANIPYQITTPILFRLIKYRHLFSRAILMMQEEVAARLVAEPGSRDYGRLTVGVGLYCDIDSGFKVSPNAFSPKPKVWSRVVRFEFRDQPRYPVADPALLERLVFTLFSQRRKQIINPLKGMMTHLTREELSEKLVAAGFSPSDRPATLAPAELVRLAGCLATW